MSAQSRSTPRSRWLAAITATLAATLIGVAGPSAAGSARPAASTPGPVHLHHACAAPGPRHVACLSIVDADATGRPLTRAAASAAGLHPYTAADLQSAYHLPSALLGARQTIAIVDAFDDPTAESDLAAYRAANGLPPCTTANGCFTKVNQRGQQGSDPPPDAGWALEESLDVDMVSAACPNCRILLVEADDATFDNMSLTVDEAARQKPTAISNSYGAPEFNGELAQGTHYNHPGIAITASSGDAGFGATFPAALANVTAVGGTTLYQDSSTRGWTEQAWSGAGSGCSAYVAKPSWQKDRLCGKRTVADVAAVADPNTPVAVYDTYGAPGWLAVGGTSATAPIVAGVYALAGNTAAITPDTWLYAHHTSLNDVSAGANGNCGGSYLCTAVKGYDGPTGWGTPNSIDGF